MSAAVQDEDEIIPLSGFDTSLLSLIAENPSLPAEKLDRLIQPAPEHIQGIARAIVAEASGDPDAGAHGEAAVRVARAILAWVQENRRDR